MASTFKTLLNVGMNVCNDYSVPVQKTIEKTKVINHLIWF